MPVKKSMLDEYSLKLINECYESRNKYDKFSEEYDTIDYIITRFFEHKNLEVMRNEMLKNAELFL